MLLWICVRYCGGLCVAVFNMRHEVNGHTVFNAGNVGIGVLATVRKYVYLDYLWLTSS